MSDLLDAIRASGLLDSPELADDIVHGRAHLAAAVADVSVTVDAEEEDVYAADLVDGLARILDITEPQWSALIDEIATELEDAVGDEPIAEPTDLRDDLSITSIVVLPDATLLTFAAPKQFPDAWVRVQLDEDLEVEDLVVDAKDDDDAEVLEFDTMDELLDEISKD